MLTLKYPAFQGMPEDQRHAPRLRTGEQMFNDSNLDCLEKGLVTELSQIIGLR